MKFLMLINLKLLTIANSFLLNIAEHEPALVAQLDAPSDWRPGGRGFLFAFSYLLAEKISCSAEMIMKNVL